MSRSPSRTLRRESLGRPVRPVILIVCEGEKTEPRYFASWRRRERINALVEIVPGNICGTDPRRIVKYARDRVLAGGVRYDQVWCVFDRDEHKYIERAFELAGMYGLNLAFSNPNFELWFLLHFKNQTSPITRYATVRELRKYLGRYKKSEDIYPLLVERQAIAIRRARSLRSARRSGAGLARRNPFTNVDRLVEVLNLLSGLD